MTRAELLAELEAALDEIVAVVEATAQASGPCRGLAHSKCYPMGNIEHVWCDCTCHDDWE